MSGEDELPLITSDEARQYVDELVKQLQAVIHGGGAVVFSDDVLTMAADLQQWVHAVADCEVEVN